MGKLGELLRSTREGKGLTLQQVEEETNMRWKYIEALEQEDYDVIPGKAYVKGFLRNYAAFLELDPEEVLEQYQNTFEKETVVVATQEDTQRSKRKTSRRKSGSSRLALTVFLVLAVAGLVWGGSALLSNKSNPGTLPEAISKPPVKTGTVDEQTVKQAPAQQTPPAQPITPVPKVAQPQPSPIPGTVQYSPVDVTLKAVGGQCWLNVVSDGAQAFQGTINAGQTLTFKGNQNISIRFGNAGVVQVMKNGVNLGSPGARGQVITKVFTK